MATFLVYGQFYPYVNPVPRSGSNNRSQAIAILASVLCKKMRLAIPMNANQKISWILFGAVFLNYLLQL